MGEKKITKFGVSMPHPIVFEIDRARGDIPRSRFILRIIERALAAGPEQEKENQWYAFDNKEALG
jgi:metal-responsive CopG/Arc/MetJ family transcriptional regulator